MEMKISKIFYMLELKEVKKKQRWIYDVKKEGVAKLKVFLKDHKVDDLSLFEINTETEEWKIRQIGWKDIVKDLI